jgi:hypothetical protein
LSRVKWLRRVLNWQSDLLHLTTKYTWVSLGLTIHDRIYHDNSAVTVSTATALLAPFANPILVTAELRVPFLPLLATNSLTAKSSQSQSFFTTDDQSVSKSWFQAPWGSHDLIFIYVDIYEYWFYRLRAPHQITVDYINCCTLLYLDTSTVISYLHLFSVTCGHIKLSDNPISEKFRNENDVTYEVDAFVHVVLGKL